MSRVLHASTDKPPYTRPAPKDPKRNSQHYSLVNWSKYPTRDIHLLIRWVTKRLRYTWTFDPIKGVNVMHIRESATAHWSMSFGVIADRISIRLRPPGTIPFPVPWLREIVGCWQEIFVLSFGYAIAYHIQQQRKERYNATRCREICTKLLMKYRMSTLDIPLLMEKAGYEH